MKNAAEPLAQERAAPSPAPAEGEPGAKPVQTVEEKPVPALSPEEYAELKSRAAKAQEHWDLLLRTTADFDNFKKRAARERQDAVRYANEALLQKLIPVLDNFDMALAAAATAKEGTAQSLQAGVNMILSQLKSVLIESGLEEIDASGQPFDPNLHEAVAHEESPDASEGQVLRQLRRGYRLRDRLLRPATVVVAKKPEPPPA